MLPEKRDPEPDSSPPLRLLKRPVATAENQVLQSLVSGSVAQVVLAVAAVLALSYAGKLPLVTMLLSLLVAFVLAPVSDFLERWRSPRWASSFVAVFLLLAALYARRLLFL